MTALLNTNLKGQPLVHSLTLSEARIVIAGVECAGAVGPVRGELKGSVAFYALGGESDRVPDGFKDLRAELDAASTKKPSPSARAGVGAKDLLFYIYTRSACYFEQRLNDRSGTTGLPKAARIKHQRFFLAGVSFSRMFGVRADDRIYCPLPVYHRSDVRSNCSPLILGDC